MIISHKYKFIFIKTAKTAGTSIEIALSKFCGPDDAITPISPEDEKTRRELGFRGPQNFLYPIWRYGSKDYARLVLKARPKLKYINHISAKKVRSRAGRQIWDEYFKFAVERNPWDRVVSMYFWEHKTEPRPTMLEFLNSKAVMKLKKRGLALYTIDGEVAMDKVCRFEHLAEDLEEVRVHLGIPEALVLPRAKSRFRSDKRGYKEILSAQEQQKIAELFADEIMLFGYEF